MTYDIPMPAGSDDILNSLARDWHEYDSPSTEVVPPSSPAQECIPTLPDEGQSVLFGSVPKDEQSGLINFRVRQAE